MHVGAERSKRTADLLEEFLRSSPQLDPETIALVESYATSQRTLNRLYASAVTSGRTELKPEEKEAAADCIRLEVFLIPEICERIDFDSLVIDSP